MTDGVVRVVHVLALAIWAGTAVFFNGCVALRIFAYFHALPQEAPPSLTGIDREVGSRMAGDLISTIFPTYFAVQLGCGLVAAATAWWLVADSQPLARSRAVLLTVTAVLVLIQIVGFYRPTSELRQQQYAALDAGDREQFETLRRRFFALHGPSLLLDCGTTLAVLVAVGMLGPALKPGTTKISAGSAVNNRGTGLGADFGQLAIGTFWICGNA